MKLSTQKINQKLQRLGPLKQLSGKLKTGADKRTDRGKAANQRSTVNKTPKEKPLEADSSAAVDDSKPGAQTDKSQSGSAQSGSAQSGNPPAKRKAAVPAFIQNSKLVRNSKSARVAFHLLLVKPWVLVVGLWLVSALSAVVALEGLISPSKLKQALPEPAAEVTPVAKADGFIDVEQSADGLTAEDADSNNAGVAESAPEAADVSDSRFPVWPLVMLVGSCAAGCVVISRRRAMLRMTATRARNRGRKLPGAKTPLKANGRLKASPGKPIRRKSANGLVALVKPAASSIQTSSKDSAQLKKRRQRKRPATQQTTTKGSSGNRVLLSRSNAQQAAPKTRVSKPSKPQRSPRRVARTARRRQAVVSVVPANQSHRLDWTEGSLAHEMDVRQKAL